MNIPEDVPIFFLDPFAIISMILLFVYTIAGVFELINWLKKQHIKRKRGW